ncbi:MAG: hypothetical protein ACLVG9_07025 [Eubacteriales bacterium]
MDGAQNAALLAVQILRVEDKALADKLLKSREENTKKVLEKNAAIEKEYQN